MRVVLLGPPGAGKGTLAGSLKERFGLVHISTGDMLREEMKNGTELGQKISKIVESGELVPDEVVIQLIKQKISTDKDVQNGFMLDGFPRTESQAEALDNILSELDQPITCSVYMNASLEIILQRLTGRRVCKKCGALFHVINMPAKQEGVCDACGGELYQRADDNEETIKKRMDVYSESTKPIIEYYKKQDKLVEVDANKNSQEVKENLLKLFNEDGKFNSNSDTRGN